MQLARHPTRAGPMFMPGEEDFPGIKRVEMSENSREPVADDGTTRGVK